MKVFLTLFSVLFSVVAFAADKEENQKAAVVLETYSKEFDFAFFAKLVLVFVLAIVAAVSYAQFVKQERETEQ